MLKNFKKYSFQIAFTLFFPFSAWGFDSFYCVGSEPFWKLTITEQEFIFQLQNEPQITMSAVEPKSAENMNIDHIRVFNPKVNNKDAIIIIQKQSCTDDMSENVFDYEGLFIFNNKIFHGCCNKKLILSH